MKSLKERTKSRIEDHTVFHKNFKLAIITDIWEIVKSQPDKTIDMMEKKGCPAIVTNYIDDQESETITELKLNKNECSVIVVACYYDDEKKYKIEDFEIPMLIEILTSAYKHM